jgi:hypothetical protein
MNEIVRYISTDDRIQAFRFAMFLVRQALSLGQFCRKPDGQDYSFLARGEGYAGTIRMNRSSPRWLADLAGCVAAAFGFAKRDGATVATQRAATREVIALARFRDVDR